MYLRLLAILFFISLNTNTYAQKLISYSEIHHYTQNELEDIWKENKINKWIVPISNGFKLFEVIYTTSWHDGSTIKASGLYFMPDNFSEKELPQMIYHHGTRTLKKTTLHLKSENAISAGFAADGYLVIMPDYIGLGKGDKFHLYQNSKSEATASIDMLLAIQELNNELSIKTNKQLFLTGYSQGGHACMATHKTLEEDYADQFTITASSPMSGAYDMSGVQATVMVKPYPQPVYLPYLLIGINEVYNITDSYSKLFRAPYDSLIPILYNGEYNANEINKFLPEIPADVVHPTLLEKYQNNPDFRFNAALKENDLLDWKTTVPTQLCYCNADKIVLYENAIVAHKKMKENGSKTIKLRKSAKKLGHVNCALFTSIYTKMWFDSFRKGSKKGRKGSWIKRFLLYVQKGRM
jgi:pimeloyl-ACP methyl ester carboxylesterase